MSYGNYDDDCYDDFDEDDNDWQIGDDAKTVLPVGTVPSASVTHTGEMTSGTVSSDRECTVQDSGGFPQPVAMSKGESVTQHPCSSSSSQSHPVPVQLQGTGTATATAQKPMPTRGWGQGRGRGRGRGVMVLADHTNDVVQVVQNNPKVSASWIKGMLTNEQEGSKAPVGSREVC
ncbi:hypothetical protein NP493_1675g00004 [Ridgeia piscesae]|uniref:Uncharacterized protein n=1 Tax=Ridgeia piscesae TaxID=27915 RepID=A0AAD9N9I6_RIDPI|nr:hypothetical protein NP493_1675g00004 [Ridgeia piscesae]